VIDQTGNGLANKDNGLFVLIKDFKVVTGQLLRIRYVVFPNRETNIPLFNVFVRLCKFTWLLYFWLLCFNELGKISRAEITMLVIFSF
jgi:hypothetical protein